MESSSLDHSCIVAVKDIYKTIRVQSFVIVRTRKSNTFRSIEQLILLMSSIIQ